MSTFNEGQFQTAAATLRVIVSVEGPWPTLGPPSYLSLVRVCKGFFHMPTVARAPPSKSLYFCPAVLRHREVDVVTPVAMFWLVTAFGRSLAARALSA